ncbi:hypothetical protein VNO77_21547 [Canavalia gladiata]|uniref:BAG domain-containing protein n=1 Tax=Canavalia gladiata TaxID=3824 RepID=A0AAN9QRN5_CANGL
MMQMNSDTPLYRTPWGMAQPRYKVPSKVVSIPVHFVGSERSRSDSAIRIQKVVRGFMVRKIMRKIAAIKVELEQIESKVHAPETVELMRKEQRERVRVSETIMNLLLRLDSVRVFHYFPLRDCRKSLIKKAIALQELVDQMVGSSEQDQPQTTQAQDEGVKMEALENDGEGEESVATSSVEENCLVKEEEHEEIMEAEEGKCVGEESLVEEVGENCLEKEEEGQEEGMKMEPLRKEEMVEIEEKGKEEGEGGLVEDNCLVKEEKEDIKGGRREECDGNTELLEKMMEDNEKMMEMMTQLFQRNEMQTKLLCSLTHRVEQLERAFTCDKLRRKKRRNANASHKQTDRKNGSI